MIHAVNLEDQVRETLRHRIVCGRLPPGEKVVESRLSEDLHVSRTPIRAALSALAQDGLVRSRPNFGWSVTALSVDEAAQLYPVLCALEDLAMRTSGILGERRTLAKLEALNARIRSAASPRVAVEVNARWHETLVGGCGNDFLLGVLARVRDHVLRYEYAYFQSAKGIDSSHAFHARIQEALQRGDIQSASEALHDHWLSDFEFLSTVSGDDDESNDESVAGK